jgi:ABC-2 type transport system permease protein
VIFFIFVGTDGISFSVSFFSLIIPIITLAVFNIGVGLILSAMYVFFRDTGYLYEVFLTLLNYLSAIFYSVDNWSLNIQHLFLLNPVYCYIRYFRVAVIDGVFPSLILNLLCIFYAAAAMGIGSLIYKKFNHEFLYYI